MISAVLLSFHFAQYNISVAANIEILVCQKTKVQIGQQKK
jgi:hypothetical protein